MWSHQVVEQYVKEIRSILSGLCGKAKAKCFPDVEADLMANNLRLNSYTTI